MCALNLSGDSGTLHLAVMTGVPTVSWWSPQSSFNEFMPAGRQHRMLVATGVEAHGLTGLTCASLLGAVRELLP
jgi:ADP-heptose:LPS heptosyltransferase